ncbi:ABC transporter ATP-binding protein [Holdemania filiformis]|uniref:ABC transporter ATP-binding protein n=1 Tax=Holdemania filiformis TaxID=61171 RepID=A0A412FUN7_9FIRM|nr:ABC transporter ATP-binding protein [Holdemania filiformis]MBS5001664.1 ABC transporter ATP-binding protein [Holdemania filiformis]RGR71882.1 ABC transporter ATP-binding protein [Holdemania filiformis]
MNRKATIRRLIGYLKESKFLLLLACVTTIVANVLALYGPKLTGIAIDAIGGPGQVNFDKVLYYCVLMILFYVISSVLTYILQIILLQVSKKITHRMRKQVFDHLLELPVSYFDRNQTGDIVSKISYDIDTINTSLSSDILQLVTGVITVVGSLLMMLSIAPVLVLVFVITVPITLVFARYRMIKVKPLFRRRSRKLGELNGFTEEMLSGNKTIKAYGQEDTIITKYDSRNEDASQAYYTADYEGSIMGPSVNFVNNLSLSLISMFGAILFLLGKITIGNISSFVMYSRKFSGPINETANIITELQTAAAAAERVFRLLDEPSEIPDAPDAKVLIDTKGMVDIDHVKFGYTPEKEIIHDLRLHADPGQLVAIVGPTGAGKTTIINLLMRFYDVNEGVISVDGYPIRNLSRDSLRKAFTMVLQDTWLFQGTIEENVAYAREDATLEEVIDVCKKAHIHDFVETLPQGYQTVLTDDGVNISKGQKQLLTIARAMLSNARMLILDEATSNVDSRTEMAIQDAMLELMKGRTCFVIAHRLSTIKNADVILVLKDGDIIESGTHDELLQARGFYAKLFNSQFES